MVDRDLVIVRAGERSLHRHWLERNETRPWDLFVSPFHDILAEPRGASGVWFGEVLTSPKFISLHQLLSGWDGWREYRYVMLADDDLFMREAVISRFFRACTKLGAKIAQPALTEDSFFSHPLVIRNRAFSAREVAFVEVMTPCFRTDVLADLLETFAESKTGWGWGLDSVWPKLLGYKDLFIVDAAPVFHTRPVGHVHSKEMRRSLYAEEKAVLTKHRCRPIYKTLAGLTREGIVSESDPRFLQLLLQGYQSFFEAHPALMKSFLLRQLQAVPASG